MCAKQVLAAGVVALLFTVAVGVMGVPAAAAGDDFDEITESPDYNLVDDDTVGLIGARNPDLAGEFGLEHELEDYLLDREDEVDVPDDFDSWDVGDTPWSSDESGVYDGDYDWVTDDPGFERWHGDSDE